MAVHSIIRDLTFFVGTWAIPKGFSETYYLAAGNSTSCSVQAFFAEASLGVFTYVGAICMCSYCAVKHDYKEESYERFEKISHVLCSLIPVFLALILVSTGLEAPDGVGQCYAPVSSEACFEEEMRIQYGIYTRSDYCTNQSLNRDIKTGVFLIQYIVPIVSCTVSFVAIFAMGAVEIRKRRTNKLLLGKRQYIEVARKNKSKQNFILACSHLVITFGTNSMYRASLNYGNSTETFTFTLLGILLTTLNGFFNAILYLCVKNRKSDDATSSMLLSKHSIRKSIRSVENVSYVSHGYRPKKFTSYRTVVHTSTQELGIYCGSEDDCDDDDNYGDYGNGACGGCFSLERPSSTNEGLVSFRDPIESPMEDPAEADHHVVDPSPCKGSAHDDNDVECVDIFKSCHSHESHDGSKEEQNFIKESESFDA